MQSIKPKADYIIANPPFNVSDWSGDLLCKDGRWQYGTPPTGNANYAWIQHFIYHLAPSGQAGFVLAKGALTSKRASINKISLVRLRSLEPLERAPLVRLRLKNQREAGIWVLRNNLAGRRNPEGDYEDVKGFCNAAPIERVKELDYVLTPGRYVGLAEEA
jgi:type I restriction enzyme M protein